MDDVPEAISEAKDPLRLALLKEISLISETRYVDPSLHAILWLSDLDYLKSIVDGARERPWTSSLHLLGHQMWIFNQKLRRSQLYILCNMLDALTDTVQGPPTQRTQSKPPLKHQGHLPPGDQDIGGSALLLLQSILPVGHLQGRLSIGPLA
ncbi:uncharacterized protein N7529_000635 [Penicillium soppii]|uniref:uncharacterized protein n=1 Tax=Penicillium soppii TaxID=69789 RepID=UPI0025499A22|nr:uncharacterized protein N7529_000635 [Penicillium soppii]KAJ5881963.1 hypothetical protein N7529_000635 [Penicillium soppii]